jgi:hypothetical protein
MFFCNHFVSGGSNAKLYYVLPSWYTSFFGSMVKSEAENVMEAEV